jgi:N-acetylglutamate synthase-like GNAT family acetyltransferase/protein-tyrosine-phosphatase
MPTLRPASAADLPAIESLRSHAKLPTDGVAGSLDHFIVAEESGAIIGAGGIEVADRAGLLRSVVVHPDHRGQGLGQRLTSRLLVEARERGLETLWLLTETAADFFPAFGFRTVPRAAAPAGLQATAEFSHCCPSTAVTMARRVAPLRVLVLCTANAARSQLGEALLQHRGGDLVSVASAGTAPGDGPHPLAIETLQRRGIAWEGKRSKTIEEAGGPWELVITVCDGAREACPVLPGHAMLHWSYPDPAAADPAERRVAFDAVADDLERRIDALLGLPLATMSAAEIAKSEQRTANS